MSNTRTTKLIIRSNDSEKIILEIPATDTEPANLSGMKLQGAAMYAIELRGLPKSGSPIYDLTQRRISASGMSFVGTDLSDAVFSEENIVGADFSNANLSKAIFVRSTLARCRLAGADFTGSRLSGTSFVDCPSLAEARGLDSVEHTGPSVLDNRTLRACVGTLPDAFLLGTGYTTDEISTLRVLYHQQPRFYSCFISYARSDADFASYLRSRLIREQVSCWQDTYDLLGGRSWRGQIYDAIEKHDKLILVCSRVSLIRPAVVEEIIETIERERDQQTQKLFPIRLDDYIFSDELDRLARSKTSSGEWRENWVSYVRSRHIPDFSRWSEPRRFSLEFKKLLAALKHPAAR